MKSQVAPRNTRAVLTIEGLCARPKGFSLHDLDCIHSDYQVDDVSKVEEKLQGRAVRLRGLIDQVGPGFQAKFVTVESEDGAFTACLPMEEMKRKFPDLEVDVSKELDESVGELEVAARDLSRAFSGIINNAIFYAMEGSAGAAGRGQDGGRARVEIETNAKGDREHIIE